MHSIGISDMKFYWTWAWSFFFSWQPCNDNAQGNRSREGRQAARSVEKAIEKVLGESDLRTPDMGGKGTTEEVGEAIASAVA